MKPSRPVLRYYGGKYKLSDWITSFFPDHLAYVEPYGGAASVLLAKDRVGREIYNDLEGRVVNVFRVLRDRSLAVDLERVLRLTPWAREEFDMARSLPPASDEIEMARRTIVQSFLGYGSAGAGHRWQTGFRSRRAAGDDSPAREWSTYPDAIREFTERLRAVVIERRDGLDVMREYDSSETLHYVDPPYVGSTLRHRARYNHSLTDEQHVALIQTLRDLKGMVALSAYPSPLYDDLLAGWHQETCRAVTDGNTRRTEILWMNPAFVERQPAPRLLA